MSPDAPLPMLGGQSATEFLRDHWQRRPLLIRGAFPDFECPLDPDELAGLACEEGVEARIVEEHGKDGPGRSATAPSTSAPSPSCPSATGPCWCRPWTTMSPRWPNCSSISPSCRAGGSTTS